MGAHARPAADQISIDADRCVHSHSPLASCTRCVEACPRGALELGDAALELDEAACDGCGLCAPACPDGAIELAGLLPQICEEDDGSSAFVACERAAGLDDISNTPCVHGIGLRMLFDLYGRGMRRTVCSTGDCAQCERSAGKPLRETVDEANKVLASRQADRIVLEDVTPGTWRRRLRGARRTGPSDPARRGFLRRAARPLTRGENFVGCAYPGLPPAPKTGDPLFVHVPELSQTECRGCDACVRICPHEAILLWRFVEDLAYVVNAERCSGCALCVDVCDARAITVKSLVSSNRPVLPLQSSQCRACGVRFHAPRGSGRDHGLCHICADAQHHGKLFQINA